MFLFLGTLIQQHCKEWQVTDGGASRQMAGPSEEGRAASTGGKKQRPRVGDGAGHRRMKELELLLMCVTTASSA